MNCETVRQQLPLYVYGELSFESEEQVASHLDKCSECRKELELEKRVHCAVDMAEMRPPAELLERCRRELPRTLENAGVSSRRGKAWRSWRQWIFGGARGTAPAWMRPAGAVALVALGFFAARLTTAPEAGLVAEQSGSEPVATQVRYLEPAASGGVRIVFDETRQREISGSLDDEAVMRMLLAASRSPSDPGVRVESLDLLNSRSESEEVRNALLQALENDPNDGVRLKALEGLRSYAADTRSRQALSRVLLTDDNPGIRSMAVDMLVQSRSMDVVGTLQELLQREENSYIRNRSERALEAMNASVETF